MRHLIVLILLLTTVVAGCAREYPVPSGEIVTGGQDEAITEPVTEDIQDIEAIDDELDTSDLESIGDDLDQIDW